MTAEKTKQLNMRISYADRERLKAIARARGMTLSGWLHHIIATTPIKPKEQA